MIITFTNVIGAIRNAISSVITTNLKMWLGFETSETLGTEEVVNGDFSDGTNDWAKSTASSATISVNANDQLVLASDAGDTLGAYSSISLIEGQTYTLSIDYISSNQLGRIEIGTSTSIGSTSPDDIFNAGGSGVELGTNTYTFTASATQATRNYLYIGGRDDVNSLVIDNVSLKELTQITPDKSGNNNVGELFTGKALDFNGSTDYVDVDGFQMAGTNATFAFWFNSNDTLGRFFDIITGFNNRFILSFNNNQISILDDTVSWFNFGSVTTNVWNRCVITINGTTAKCFVNGVQLGTDKTISTIDFSSSTDAAIGSMVFGTQSYFDGSLSDFQIYNSAWSTDDIAYDYANPNKLAIDNPSTSLSVTNLKAYWALSEGDGLVAYDSSGEGNNGTINGATYEPAQPRIPQLGMQNWSKGSNLFSYSQDFSQWNKEATVTLTPNYGTSPSGANDSTRIQMNANDSLYLSNAGSSKNFSIYVKGTQSETIRLSNGITALFTLTGDWDRIQLYDTSGASILYSFNTYSGATARDMEIWGGQLEDSSSAGAYRLTDGAATLNSTVIANPTIPTKDIFGNAVRDRLNSFNLGKFGGARLNAFTLSGNQATIQLWFKNVNSNDSLYLADLHSATDRIVLGFNSSQLSVYHEITNYWFNFGTITDGDWNFATFTFDGTTMKCFIGTTQLGGTKTINTGINIGTTTDFGIGMNHSFPTRTQDYNGHISDFLIYDRVLTSDEIENNYNAGLSAHTN